MLDQEAPESGNAFCDWLDSAARPSFVSFFIILMIFNFSGKLGATALSAWTMER
jgi:hypothetical protein